MERVRILKDRLAEMTNLTRTAALLEWDQSTYMPPGGAAARAEQLATLHLLAHRLLIDPEMGRLLDTAEAEVHGLGLGPDDDATCLVRVARRDYERAIRLPTDLVAEISRTASLAYGPWVTARETGDFAAFAPWLQKNLDLARRKADLLGYEEHPYNAMISGYEPGMTVERLRRFFSELRAGLTPLVQAAAERPDAVDDSVLHRPFDEGAQMRFAEEVAAHCGYDFSRGRLDLTVHPFATSFSRDDVRITTRVSASFFPMCLMGTLHESGHGMYEQNIDESLEGTLLASGTSAGVHESQSRLWENLVGRSRGFWHYYLPRAQQVFPDSLGPVDVETLYRALNKVSPSTIRVEADELTYNMHIMLRFELEIQLLEGRLAVGDLPAAWTAAMHEYLGITPPDDAEGVLQDVHWSFGGFAVFPGYAIGNVLSVQLYDAAVRAVPSIAGEIRSGQFGGLLDWLRENVYRHGRKYDPDDLITRATGRPMDTGPYLQYLRDKFGVLYGLPAPAMEHAGR